MKYFLSMCVMLLAFSALGQEMATSGGSSGMAPMSSRSQPGVSSSERPRTKSTRRSSSSGKRRSQAKSSGYGSHANAPIWPSFMKNFKACAPGCEPMNYGTHGKRGNPTCHTGGHAVDVGAIRCGGKTHRAQDRGRFQEFVNCMGKKMKKIYWTKNHYDHVHLSNGCVRNGRKMW